MDAARGTTYLTRPVRLLRMALDDIMRMVLLVFVAIFIPWGLYHRIKAHTGEKLDRRQEGMTILFGLRLTAVVLVIGTVAWFVHPPAMAWASLPLPGWSRWLGLALVPLAGGLFIWTMHVLGGNLTDTVVTRTQHTLITRGPYRWVRHPFYLATAAMVVAVSLAMASWFVLLLGSIVVVFLLVRTSIEERQLIDRFGDAYRDYMRRVGRFLPRLR